MTTPEVATVLAALDLGPAAAAVGAAGCSLARAIGGAITLVHVLDEPRWLEEIGARLRQSAPVLEGLVPRLSAHRAEAAAALESARANHASSGVPCAVVLRRGAPYRLLAEEAAALGAAMLVVGPHARARPGDRLLGTTTDRLLRIVETPVWIVPAPEPPSDAARVGAVPALEGAHWVVGVDFSAASASAVRTAARLAHALGGTVTLAHAMPRVVEPRADREDADAVRLVQGVEHLRAQALEDLGGLAASAGLWPCELVVEAAEPAALFARVLEGRAGGVVCVGATGRGAVARALLGSTVQRCLRAGQHHVLVVPP